MFRGEVFIPIISIVLFLVFLCTDKESKFRKILYSSNVILWGITLFTGLIIEQLPVGYGAVYPNLAFYMGYPFFCWLKENIYGQK